MSKPDRHVWIWAKGDGYRCSDIGCDAMVPYQVFYEEEERFFHPGTVHASQTTFEMLDRLWNHRLRPMAEFVTLVEEASE